MNGFDFTVNILNPGCGSEVTVNGVGPIEATAQITIAKGDLSVIQRVVGRIYTPNFPEDEDESDINSATDEAREEPTGSGLWVFSSVRGAQAGQENHLVVWGEGAGGIVRIDYRTFIGVSPARMLRAGQPIAPAVKPAAFGPGMVYCPTPRRWRLEARDFANPNLNGRYFLNLTNISVRGNSCEWICPLNLHHPKAVLQCECPIVKKYVLKIRPNANPFIFAKLACHWDPAKLNVLKRVGSGNPRTVEVYPV
jgi:hypothetical protein